MFISYTFAYIYLCLSLAGFIKDIFLKDICKRSLVDANIISDMKVTFPVVIDNVTKVLKTLAIIDAYFFVFGSNYGILASLFYFVIGLPIMFWINSIMSMGNVSYLQSRHTYDSECGITTRNPMYVFFCDEGIIFRFNWLLFIMTFMFGRNEYLVLGYLFVPYIMTLVPLLNLDLARLDENYDLDSITENPHVIQVYNYFLRYENYVLIGADKVKNVFFFLKSYLPKSTTTQRKRENNELGDINTYDTIPEATTKPDELVLKSNDDVNNFNEGKATDATNEGENEATEATNEGENEATEATNEGENEATNEGEQEATNEGEQEATNEGEQEASNEGEATEATSEGEQEDKKNV